MTGRRSVATALPALLALSVAASVPSIDTTTAIAAYEVRALTVDVMVGPRGDTPCRLAADLYRPAGATKTRPAPAILTSHGFGGSKADQQPIGAAFASEGYVVLAYSGLGFGGSGCRIRLDDPDWDGKAGAELVRFLGGSRGATDASSGAAVRIDYVRLDGPGDPRVGMVGGSYGGQNQFAVAAVSQQVDALVPIITWHDLRYSIAPNNAAASTPGVFKKQWGNFFFADGIISGAQYATVDPARNTGCPNFPTELCAALPEAEALGYPNPTVLDVLRRASVVSYVPRVKAPTLLMQGEQDTLFNLQEAVATYRGLKAQGTPVSMVWQSWGHSHGQPAAGELDLANPRTSYLGRRIANWFDRWLKDNRRAPASPAFEYYRDWTGSDITGAYAQSSTYPVGANQSLYLSGADALVTSAPAPGSQTYAGSAPTSYSETSGLEGSVVNHPPTDAPGTFAAWTSTPLTRPATIVGAPTLDVRISAPTAVLTQASGPAGQLVVFAKIYDVAPDGTVLLKNRLISPARIVDVTKPVRIELPAVAQQFAAGHRIRVVLAASDAAYGGNNAPHAVTVQNGTLRLPVVGPFVALS